MRPGRAALAKKDRLAFLDWMRGLAAVTMLNGHAFHAFTRPDQRESGVYVLTQFIGGMPPAVFLFLVGVTLAFLMHSRERKGMPGGARVLSAMRRAGYLFLLAFLFRLQMWVFGLPKAPWTDLLRVDVLNSMGFAVLVLSLMAVFSTADRVHLSAALGVAIAVASPVVSQIDWSFAPLIKDYIVPDRLFFGFFPWAAFVAFGLSAGSLIRILDPAGLERAVQWAAILGVALVVSSQYLSNMPFSIYSKSDYWLNSPWLVFTKLGVVLLVLAFAFLWTRHSQNSWSWVRQFGTTSLLVYWVHIELMYGRWLWFWKENLDVTHVALISCAFIALMLALSTARLQWKNWRLLGLFVGWYFFVPRGTAYEDERALSPANSD
jgi:uncharacterized membrane protein